MRVFQLNWFLILFFLYLLYVVKNQVKENRKKGGNGNITCNKIKDLKEVLKKAKKKLERLGNLNSEIPVIKAQIKSVQKKLVKSNNYSSQIPGLKSQLKSEIALRKKSEFDYLNLKMSIANMKKNQEEKINKLKIENKAIIDNLQQVFKAESDQLNNVITKKNKTIQMKSEVIGNLTH